jgi:rare lipoprotein A
MAAHSRGAPPKGERMNALAEQGRAAARVALVASTALVLANCAQQPVQQRAGRTAQEQREIGAFPQARYGAASPRVVGEGEAAPKGGGRYHVGNPYRVAGRTYVPYERPVGYTQTGLASWYGAAFHGRKTANGEVYDKSSVTAAHPTMPLPSYARVSNLRNGRSIIVRVNDRGPFHGGRVLDVSERVAWALDFKGEGTTRVRVDYLGKAGLGGSDDTRLLASLRQDGKPATSPDIASSTVMVASAEPAPAPRPPVSFRQDTPVVSFTTVRRPNATPLPGDDDAASTASAPVRGVAARQPTLMREIPAPPSRPYDLGTIPNAASPVRATGTFSQPLPPVRPRLASLSYAPESGTLSKFQQKNPLAAIPQPRFERGAGKPMTIALSN